MHTQELFGVSIFIAALICFITIVVNLIIMLSRPSIYFYTENPKYHKVTMIMNSAGAIFFTSLLTNKGISQRSVMGKIIATVWIIFIIEMTVLWAVG